MTKTLAQISASDALMLQEIGEIGEEELAYIAEELHEPRNYVISQLSKLRHKGLIQIGYRYGETVVRLTNQGRHIIKYYWPEAYV